MRGILSSGGEYVLPSGEPMKMNDIFIGVVPRDFTWSFQWIVKYHMQVKEAIVTWELPLTSMETNDRLVLKGRLLYFSDSDCMVFVGTPRSMGVSGVIRQGISVDDFPYESAARDLLFDDFRIVPKTAPQLATITEEESDRQPVYRMSPSRMSRDFLVVPSVAVGDSDAAQPQPQPQPPVANQAPPLPPSSSSKNGDETLDQWVSYEISNSILQNTMTPSISSRLKSGQLPILDSFCDVTLLFADIVNFTKLSYGKSPENLVQMLNEIFCEFDRLADKCGVDKVKTIGDNYHAVAGAALSTSSSTRTTDNAFAMVEFAIGMMGVMSRLNDLLDLGEGVTLTMRVGLHTGDVVGGVIGKKKWQYDLWGDDVDVASSMESSGIPGQIQVSRSTFNKLKTKYFFDERNTSDGVERFILVGRYALDSNENVILDRLGKPCWFKLFSNAKDWWALVDEDLGLRASNQRDKCKLVKNELELRSAVSGIPVRDLQYRQRLTADRLSQRRPRSSSQGEEHRPSVDSGDTLGVPLRSTPTDQMLTIGLSALPPNDEPRTPAPSGSPPPPSNAIMTPE